MKRGVLVAGAGPVGLTMAAELARFGVPVRIVDKAAARTDKSKALVLWSRTLELIDRMGCGGSFVSAGLKVTAANIVAGRQTIAHIRLDTIETSHPYALMLPQSETERLMEKHLNSYGVEVQRRVELERFDSKDDHVTATLRHADGSAETLDAEYLIGCDGAHSAVRHGLGMHFEGSSQPSDWILADVHFRGLEGKPDELSIYWHADGVLVLIPIAPGRYRIIADAGDAKPGALRADPALEEVQAILEQRGPGNLIAFDPIWLAAFRINERKVADYRAGRVFLAGDAAHIQSPAGGQGMNTGMQDACNLAWKMALVYHGHAAPEPLLDSYSIERSAVGRQVLSDASRLTTLAILKNGIVKHVRNHIASLVFGFASVRDVMANKLAELSIGYPHSPLTLAGRHIHGGPTPGSRAPLAVPGDPVGSGGNARFALFAETTPEVAQVVSRHSKLLEPAARAPFAANTISLVRPDGYIAAISKAGERAEIEKHLQRIPGTIGQSLDSRSLEADYA